MQWGVQGCMVSFQDNVYIYDITIINIQKLLIRYQIDRQTRKIDLQFIVWPDWAFWKVWGR